MIIKTDVIKAFRNDKVIHSLALLARLKEQGYDESECTEIINSMSNCELIISKDGLIFLNNA